MSPTVTVALVAVVSAVCAVAAWEALRVIRRRRRRATQQTIPPAREQNGSIEVRDRREKERAVSQQGEARAVQFYAGEVQVASLEAFAGQPPGKQLVPTPPAIRAHVSSLVQHGVGIGSTARTLFSSAVTMRFSPEVTRGLADGSLNIMKSAQGGLRGIAVDSTGKAVGQASLDAIGRGAAAATAVWQIAAMVTAQKFLADIDAKLANIERGVAEVKEWLEDERHAELVGQAQKLKSYVRTLAEPVTQEEAVAILASLEHMDLQARQRMAADAVFMGRLREAVAPGELSGDLEEDLEMLSGLAGDYERAHQRYLLGGAVRLAATQVRGALPTSLRLSSQLAEEVAAELEAHASSHPELSLRAERTAKAMKESWYQWEETGKEARASMRSTFRELDERLAASSKGVQDVGASLAVRMKEQLEAGARGLELVVKLQEGKVVEVNEVRAVPSAPSTTSSAKAGLAEGTFESQMETARARWPALTDDERARLVRDGALERSGDTARSRKKRR